MNTLQKFLGISLLLTTSFLSSVSQAAFKIPAYETYTLDNGLQVYLMQQDEVPMIDLRLVVKVGAINDGNQFGLANLTSEALQFGSGKLSKNEIEDELAFLGANLSVNAAMEMTSINISFAAKDEVQLLPLFANIALNPSFNVANFDKYKKRFLSQLEQRKESPRDIINDAFARLYFGSHPYGNPVSGDNDSVTALTLDSVKSFYGDYYTPSNSALIVVGDFNKKHWRGQIKTLFGHWKGQAPKETLVRLGPSPAQSNVLLINKDDASETTLLIGSKGISASHPDAVAVQVINTILGGRFTSWLNDALRVNSGLTYGARSRFNSYQYGGSFSISTFTKNATTFEAIDLAKKTYRKLWEEGIDKETLASAKAYVKGQFPPRYETSGQLAALLARMWSQDLDDSYINNFENNVDSMNVIKANEIARRLFPENNLQYVLVGKADDIREKAKTYGELKEINIKDLKF
ncbi:MAG: zinc protease [Enterobacterales bacterium]|jgi:zinc protease